MDATNQLHEIAPCKEIAFQNSYTEGQVEGMWYITEDLLFYSFEWSQGKDSPPSYFIMPLCERDEFTYASETDNVSISHKPHISRVVHAEQPFRLLEFLQSQLRTKQFQDRRKAVVDDAKPIVFELEPNPQHQRLMRSKIVRSCALNAVFILGIVLLSLSAGMPDLVSVALSIPVIIKAAVRTLRLAKDKHITSITIQGSVMRLSHKWGVASAISIPLKDITAIGIDAGVDEKTHILRIHYNKRHIVFSALVKNSVENHLVRVPLPPATPFLSGFLARWVGSLAPPTGYVAGRLEYVITHVIFLFGVFMFCWLISNVLAATFVRSGIVFYVGSVVALYFTIFVFPAEKLLFPTTLDD